MDASENQMESSVQQHLRVCTILHYGHEFAQKVIDAYSLVDNDQKVYIVGCLILTLTASVHPQQTLLTDRLAAFVSAGCTESQSKRLAEIGLFAGGGGVEQNRCFHCNVRLRGLEQNWACHKSSSPNCYFVRLHDFVESVNSNGIVECPDGVECDIAKYKRALRRLECDLDELACQLAVKFGFSKQTVSFCVARHFMRRGGRSPKRAGDVIKQIYDCQELYNQTVIDTVDVASLIAGVSLNGSGSDYPVLLSRFDSQSGSYRSIRRYVTYEQLQRLQALSSSGNSSGRLTFNS